MRYYRLAYKIWTYFIGFIALLFLSSAIVNLKLYSIVVFSIVLIVFFGSLWLLEQNKKYAFSISFLMVNLLWIPLAYRTYQRFEFINKYGNFEGDDGRGSPMAFLVTFILEQLLFIPLSILLVLGVVVLVKRIDSK